MEIQMPEFWQLSPQRIALKAGQDQVKGRTTIGLYNVERDAKMTTLWRSIAGTTAILVYPNKPEHMEKLGRNSRTLQSGGTSEYYPGSIGIALLSHKPDAIDIQVRQSNYRTSKAGEGRPESRISKDFARKHLSGWDARVAKILIETAREFGKPVRIPYRAMHSGGLNTQTAFKGIIERACEQHGARLVQSSGQFGRHYLLHPTPA